METDIKNLVSDTAITAAIKSKFILDNDIKALDIHVETVNGVVTLSGKVSNSSVADRAIEIAHGTNGVKDVICKLVKIWHTPNESSTLGNLIPDSAVTAEIKGRYALDDKIKALDIHVETINGRVILSGTAPSFSAIDRAIAIAQDTSGVKEVVTDLHI